MALESWLTKVRSAISTGLDSVRSTMNATDAIAIIARKKATVGILAFEIASLMSKLLHLWRSLSDAQIARVRHETIALQGIRKIVSDDDSFLLGLACAELTDTLRLVANSASTTLSKRCADPCLREFHQMFKEFSESGHDPHRWVMSWKEMESKAKKMDRYVSSTAALYKEMDELSEAEHGLRKLLQCGGGCNKNIPASKIAAIAELQQKIFWQRQEVKYLKQTSLWSCSFDAIVSLLARSSFTVLARIKQVFGFEFYPLPRSLSISATVYPSSDTPPPPPAASPSKKRQRCRFFESNSAVLVPPPETLGAAALALHYANLIIVIEKMIRSPWAVGPTARDDLYSMLPGSVRGILRRRLRGVGEWGAASDAGLAAEWRAALARISEWLGPVAHNTVRWQGERSFEGRRSAGAAPRNGVLLLQTLFFANREKVEAAIAELLVGLNYVWRFEREMAARAALMHMDSQDDK
ncbi:protein PSK SIMULATOR 1 [Phoenix dactylifera]|uniref:Protein PSK SIMULATOR 1 n=1 Tax=Phoenix dactylifera TaxID=42345 RepID=A0A8B7BGD5_PHODC|nr:protein PSK SIMULATOR 1 [Phoenix dactylifera]